MLTIIVRMKLQKRANRKVGDKEYVKWYVNIPIEKIQELNWKEGQNLALSVNKKKLTIEPDEKG